MVRETNKVKPATPGAIAEVDALVLLSLAVMERMQQVGDRHELSIVQMRLLGILRDREPGMQDLARVLKLDKSSVSGLVDRAERRGLVARAGREDDRRAVHVSLTATGRKLVKVVEKDLAEEMGRLVSALSEGERRQVSALANKILAGISTV